MDPRCTPWTLLLGPGPRLAGLRPALDATASDRLGPDAPPVRAVDDPLALLEESSPGGRLLLDADAIHPEDLGLVRRFLSARPSWEALLTGTEEGSRTARCLLGLDQVRWRSWPLDVEQLDLLITPPCAEEAPAARLLVMAGAASLEHEEAASAEQPPAPSPSLARHQLLDLEQDLEAIEEILAQEEEVGQDEPDGDLMSSDPRDVDLTPEEIDAFFGPDPVETESSDEARAAVAAMTSTLEARELDKELEEEPAAQVALVEPTEPTAQPEPASWAPPAWYRDQVADLADRAQRLHLALATVEEDPDQLHALALDVTALTQFARTLGFLVSPPGPGQQELDMNALLEELLAGVAGVREDGPRYLFRSNPDAQVRSDKALLVAVFDALLQLVDACASADDVVRVALEGDEDEVSVVLTFPAGPLDKIPMDSALAPYALHRVVPTVGPNAMAAAGRILQGQGGDLAFGEGEEPGQRVLIATLPRV